jgi:hypothetical protein
LRIATTIAVLGIATAAAAEPAPDLRVRGLPLPLPEHLHMRVVLKEPGDAAPATRKTPAPAATSEDVELLDLDASLRQQVRESDSLGQRRRLDEKVVLNVSLGVGLDGGQPETDATLLSGAPLDESNDYTRLRSYSFGDLILGTNGLGTRSLRTYFSTSYRFDTPLDRNAGPVPTVYDGELSDYVVHAAWIDLEDVFSNRVLKPLYVRVGRQFKYGVAVTQFSGITLGYKTRAFRAAGFVGTRASPYGFAEPGIGEDRESEGLTGLEATFDFYDLNRFPLVLSASQLSYDDRNHIDASAALRWSRNVLVRGKARLINGEHARQTLKVRTRISEVTTIAAEIDNRTANDWAYDLLLVTEPDQPGDPRSYLNFGIPRPRVRAGARGGTVLLRNIDLLLSTAAAIEYADSSEQAPSAFHSSYLEAGAAVEVRLRRNLRLGASSSGRLYRRPRRQRATSPDMPDPLPLDTGATGERTFGEGGLSARYSLGARKFSASAELYGRALLPRSEYIREEEEQRDTRTGGRFSIDGWASEKIRLGLVYDLSFGALRYAPELEGIKSLRLTAEGTF